MDVYNSRGQTTILTTTILWVNTNINSDTNKSISITNTTPVLNPDNSYSSVINVKITTNANNGAVSISRDTLLSTQTFTADTSPYTKTLVFPVKSTTSGSVSYTVSCTLNYGDGSSNSSSNDILIYYGNSSSNNNSNSTPPLVAYSYFHPLYIIIPIIIIIVVAIISYKLIKKTHK